MRVDRGDKGALLLLLNQKHAALLDANLLKQRLRYLRLNIIERVAHPEHVVTHSLSSLTPLLTRSTLHAAGDWFPVNLCCFPEALRALLQPALAAFDPGILRNGVDTHGQFLLVLRVHARKVRMLLHRDHCLVALQAKLLNRGLGPDRLHHSNLLQLLTYLRQHDLFPISGDRLEIRGEMGQTAVDILAS